MTSPGPLRTRWILSLAAAAVGLGTLCGAPSGASARRQRHAPRRDRAMARDLSAGGARPSRGPGRVQFVTERRVYLDRGAADGLAPGQTVLLLRNPRPPRKCTVEIAGDHQAVCNAAGAHVGQLIRITSPRPRPSSRGAARPPPPPPSDETLWARAQVIARAPHEKVAFAGQSPTSLASSTRLAAGIMVRSGSSDAPGKSVAEEIDVQLRRIRLGESDFRLDAAFTALRWQTRSAAMRFRPDSPTQLYVHELEVSRRELGDRTVLAFGRVWPWHVPGVSVLDGAQLGHRNQAETVEVGAYGGLVPTALSLAPTADAWAAGAYLASEQRGSRDALVRLMREEGRVGVRQSATIGLVSEAEALHEIVAKAWAADGGARVRYAAAVERRPVLERAYLDVRLRPTSGAGASLQLRYLGATPEQQPLLTSEVPALRGGYHGAVEAHFAPRASLQVAITASSHLDRDSGLTENEGGIDLQLPHIFRDAGRLWLGLTGAEGWLRSRGAYVQLAGRDLARIQVLGRLSAVSNEFTNAGGRSDVTEAGGYLQVEAALTARLGVRARGFGRVPLLVQGMAPVDWTPAVVSSFEAIFAL